MKGWGFVYKTNLVWYKTRKDGPVAVAFRTDKMAPEYHCLQRDPAISVDGSIQLPAA
jgi:hypothetical protein